MQAGFSLLESGTVRTKNTANILIKNLLDACIGVIGWYFLGYGFAFGKDAGGFIGYTKFVGTDIEGDINEYYMQWFFQFTFCATAATIVSGSLAERTKLEAYIVYSFLMSSFIYPVVVHWVWSPDGWLAQEGFIDFAGSGVVHLVGGASGFIAAVILGPRYDKFGIHKLKIIGKDEISREN